MAQLVGALRRVLSLVARPQASVLVSAWSRGFRSQSAAAPVPRQDAAHEGPARFRGHARSQIYNDSLSQRSRDKGPAGRPLAGGEGGRDGAVRNAGARGRAGVDSSRPSGARHSKASAARSRGGARPTVGPAKRVRVDPLQPRFTAEQIQALVRQRAQASAPRPIAAADGLPATAAIPVALRGGELAPNAPLEDAPAFDALLSAELASALRNVGIERPTRVQAMAIPKVLRGGNVVVAAETGSGKTVAYAAPIVQMLRRAEAAEGPVKVASPRALIIAPSLELAAQVLDAVRALAKGAPVASLGVLGKTSKEDEARSIAQGFADIIVGTPARILHHVEEGALVLNDVRTVVLDEADSLLDEGFGEGVMDLVGPLIVGAAAVQVPLVRSTDGVPQESQHVGDDGREPERRVQFVFACATFTAKLRAELEDALPQVEYAATEALHKAPSNLEHRFWRVIGRDGKQNALKRLAAHKLNKPAIVFCNSVSSCDWTHTILAEGGANNVVKLHGDLPTKMRTAAWRTFKSAKAGILVCTDVAARGLDTLHVEHVIMADFPRTTGDYLHRAGRAGRMGARGRVTSILTKKDGRLSVAVQGCIARGEVLKGLSHVPSKRPLTARQTGNRT